MLLSAEKKRAFLELYHGRNMADAARLAGTTFVTIIKHRKLDAAFDAAVAAVFQSNIDKIEDNLFAAAMDPKRKINFHATIAMLNARRPEVYRQNFKVEHAGKLQVVASDVLKGAFERLRKDQDEATTH